MELGMTEYEARCFVALTQLSEGTAREISRIADVPQSRVYDIADSLHRMGVVDVQESDPRRYRVLPVQRALERLRREYSDDLETAADRLGALEGVGHGLVVWLRPLLECRLERGEFVAP